MFGWATGLVSDGSGCTADHLVQTHAGPNRARLGGKGLSRVCHTQGRVTLARFGSGGSSSFSSCFSLALALVLERFVFKLLFQV